MCLAVPGRILAFIDAERHLATVDVSGVRRTINTALIAPEGLEPGDWVLIHVGFAMTRIDEAEAKRTLDLLREMGGEE
jgi:hydrogenase expression/formation protein HypC